ncbi:MAG: response regulator [Kiritimatiellae bacterium]|nr:response regulator [Kiritimatiellia bacterium]
MKVLLIEDDYQLRMLEKRLLQNLGHEPILCEDAETALEQLKREMPPFILLDMVLPGMSGLEFARSVRNMPEGDVPYILAATSWPEDQLRSILEAGANDYIQKPIDINLFNVRVRIAEQVIGSIQDRRRMQQQMKEMVTQDVLESTLNGFIRVVTNLLSQVAPQAFGRAERVSRIVADFSTLVNLENDWELSAAAMLCQIGCVTIPPEVLNRALSDEVLSEQEYELFSAHARNGAELLSHVPRMESVARLVAYQDKHFDGSGLPNDSVQGDDIPVGSRILKIALDLDMLNQQDVSRAEAFRELASRTGWYDPKLLGIFTCSEEQPPRGAAKRVWIEQLEDGMVLAENVLSKSNALLVMKGHEITPMIRKQLSNFSKNYHIQQPIEVYTPGIPLG